MICPYACLNRSFLTDFCLFRFFSPPEYSIPRQPAQKKREMCEMKFKYLISLWTGIVFGPLSVPQHSDGHNPETG